MDCNLPGSSVRGIFQVRILKWVAMPSSRESSQPKGQTHVSCYSCLGRWILYHCSTWEARSLELIYFVYMTLHICRTATPLFPYPQPLLTTILLFLKLHIYMIYSICLFLSDTSLSIRSSVSISVVTNGNVSFSWLNNIPVCVCVCVFYTTFSLSLHPLTDT